MANGLEPTIHAMLDALARGDVEAGSRLLDDEVQGIDEISRRWLRGRAEVRGCLEQAAGAISDMRSEVRDLEERTSGDIGIATFWLEQEYSLAGRRERISAPSTVVLRRDGDEWRVLLFHSIPLPQEEAGT
jgi:ketosteroid isomerase-like protein